LKLGASGIFLKHNSPASLATAIRLVKGVFEGLANKEIAARLGVTEGAVKASLQQLFQKTQVGPAAGSSESRWRARWERFRGDNRPALPCGN